MTFQDDSARLSAVLSALGCPTVAEDTGTRKLCDPGDPRHAFDAVLQEINQTILRRFLTFRSGELSLVLDVGERRVFRASELERSAGSASARLPGDTISAEHARDLLRKIETLTQNGETIHVASELPAKSLPECADGLSVDDLLPDTNPDPADLFNRCAGFAIASVVTSADTRETEATGEPGICETLKSICDAVSGTSDIMITGGDLRDDLAVVRFATDESRGAMAVPVVLLDKVLAAVTHG